MGRRVVRAPVAAETLIAARRWLRQPGAGDVGKARWNAILAAIESLRSLPYLGNEITEPHGYRQLVVSGYRLIYRVQPDTEDNETAGDGLLVAVFGPGQL
jgi:plasmid stabilization system protein ParE